VPIYLDYNATTPLDLRVRDSMLRWLSGPPANASSLHAYGQEARRAIDTARLQVALLIGAQPEEIVFVSGGTEANNLAILGAVAARGVSKPHVVTTAIEHQAVLNPCRQVERLGGRVTFVPVDPSGVVQVKAVLEAVSEDTVLVSVMLANNEVGTLQPVGELVRALRGRGVLVHTDAVQAAGKIPIDVRALGVDLLSLSAHKLHGPQGVGALYVRRGTRIGAILFGGHQERELRPGTENVAGIAGFGTACALARERLEEDTRHLMQLRERLEKGLKERIEGVTIHAETAPRLPNTTNAGFAGLDGEALVINLDLMGVLASTGAACASADGEPSHVLVAMGLDRAEARSSVRFSFGRDTTEEEIDRAIDIIVQAVERLRGGA